MSANSTALTEGADPTEHVLSSGNQSATIAQYGDSFLLSDLLQDTSIASTMSEVLERLGFHASLKLDTVIRNVVLTAATVVRYGGSAVARNSIATDGSFDYDVAELRKDINVFRNANVKPHTSGNYVAVVHPDIVYDIQGDDNWKNAHTYTEKGIDNIYNGEVGMLYGTRFIESTLALKHDASGSASTDVYQTYYFGHQALGVAEFQNPQVIVKNPHPASDLDVYGTFGWKAGFATRNLSASALILKETGASLGD